MVYYPTTQDCFIRLFTQLRDKTVSNTTSEVSLINTTGAKGSLLLPANILQVGSVLKFKMDGIYNDASTPTATVRIKIGAITIIESATTIPSNLTNAFFNAEFMLVVRSIGTSGSICGEGTTFIKSPTSVGAPAMRALQMLTDVNINTTIDNLFDLTYQWSAASTSNSLTSRNILIEAMF